MHSQVPMTFWIVSHLCFLFYSRGAGIIDVYYCAFFEGGLGVQTQVLMPTCALNALLTKPYT